MVNWKSKRVYKNRRQDIDWLYHYTSLDKLALILKNKTLRFINLSIMDDLEEEVTRDAGNYGRFIYSSSWTKLRGNNIFDEEKDEDNPNASEEIAYTKGLLNYQREHSITFMPYKVKLVEVRYTDDEKILYPQFIERDAQRTTLKNGGLGEYKSLAWSFQKEWRYLINSYPFSIEEMNQSVKKGTPHEILDRLLEENLESLSYIVLPIKKETFDDLEILCGSKITHGQKVIINDLVEKYSPSATIKYSGLKIK